MRPQSARILLRLVAPVSRGERVACAKRSNALVDGSGNLDVQNTVRTFFPVFQRAKSEAECSDPRPGIKACAFIESWDANKSNLIGRGADVETMTAWSEHLVDRYASHPAYLRGRSAGDPRVNAANLSTAEWTSVIARVRPSGRQPLVIGDF